MSHMCKRIFKFGLQLRSYWQNIKVSRYCPKFPIFTNFAIFQVYLQLLRPTASYLKILWQGHVRNTLFHFCQLPPVFWLSFKQPNLWRNVLPHLRSVHKRSVPAGNSEGYVAGEGTLLIGMNCPILSLLFKSYIFFLLII